MSMTLIPAAALESHIGILGKTGSGKSNLAKVLAEKLMAAGERVCAVDPTGTWWGLRLAEDGKRTSQFSPVIFGGDHGDLALAEHHGTILAEAIGTSADSAIVDTQQMTVGQRTRFFTDFAEALLRTNRGTLYLIIDEAHIFAPQGGAKASGAMPAMLHAANNLVSLGRGRGLRIILISQRPAKLHKDSLTQVETLIAMRLIAPQDRAAVKDWVGEWADPAKGAEIIASLPSLPVGDAWVWAPQIGFLERKHFPLAATFDSGRPEANAKARELPPIDTAKLGEKMDAIRQEAISNDPKRLKAQIAELQRATVKPVEKVAVVDADHPAVKALLDAARTEALHQGYTEGAAAATAEHKRKLLAFVGDLVVDESVPAPPEPLRRPVPAPTVPRPAATKPEKTGDLSTDPLLRAALQVWPAKMSWAGLASMCGRKARGGHFNTARKGLLDSGLVRMDGELVTPTNPPASPEGVIPADLLEQNLPQPSAKMFSTIRAKPGITIVGLAGVLQMQPRGGHWNTGMSTLRRNGLIEERGDALYVPQSLLGAQP